MARAKSGLTGIENVMRNLNKEAAKIKIKSMGALTDAATMIRRDMDATPPKIPIDTGTLRASWTTVPGHGVAGFFMIMRFTAGYAIYVHEMEGADINWNRPGSGGKFFESALVRNQENILLIFKRDLSI